MKLIGRLITQLRVLLEDSISGEVLHKGSNIQRTGSIYGLTKAYPQPVRRPSGNMNEKFMAWIIYELICGFSLT